MAGSAAAASAAATSASVAGTVQVSLSANQFSLNIGGTSLSPDITGDGVSDFPGFDVGTIKKSFQSTGSGDFTSMYRLNAVFDAPGKPGTFIADVLFTFRSTSHGAKNYSYFASIGKFASGPSSQTNSPTSLTAFVPVTFSDARINSGASSNGLLEVRAFNSSKLVHTIQFIRTVFDNATTAAPTADLGTNYPEFIAPVSSVSNTVATSQLSRKIKKLKAKIKKAKKAGNTTKASKLNNKLKKLKKQLKAL